jgi:hypothetical protein
MRSHSGRIAIPSLTWINNRYVREDLLQPGTVTKSFIFYFEIDELSSEVRILATFIGAADHRRQILDRFER